MELYTDLHDLISARLDLADFAGGAAPEAIAAAETRLGVVLPESYRWFLVWYGSGRFGPYAFYGLGDLDAVAWTEALRATEPGFPPTYVAVAPGGPGEVLCLDCTAGAGEAPVVAWILGRPAADQPREVVAGSFVELLARRLLAAAGAAEP